MTAISETVFRATSKPLAVLAAAGVVGVLAATTALAGVLENTPVYNPETASYFELAVVDEDRKSSWSEAGRMAQSRTFNGVNGRLAIVKSKTVNDFLQTTFTPQAPAWIGLRYFCKLNTLMWVSGEIQGTGGYVNWAVQWNAPDAAASMVAAGTVQRGNGAANSRGGGAKDRRQAANTGGGAARRGAGGSTSNCAEDGSYWPVHYWTADSPQGFHWHAQDPAKRYTHYFVEYPTGAE